jgi:D-alanyl-D-alanine carboxypeptidase
MRGQMRWSSSLTCTRQAPWLRPIQPWVQPKNAAASLDRSRTDPGLLHNGDPAVHAFTDHGWRWGGYWRTATDYRHIERP